ncbi:MAG: hypothetical protein IJY88_05960 [Clostridia bacterium]|nr:hypothetical protein [Clostridia bacterium]
MKYLSNVLTDTYWRHLLLTIGVLILAVLLFLFLLHEIKRYKSSVSSFGKFETFFIGFVILCLSVFASEKLILCFLDLPRVINDDYIEVVAEACRYDHKQDFGHLEDLLLNDQVKFYITETDECLVLHQKGLEIGKTYRVVYYPHTRLCEVADVVD